MLHLTRRGLLRTLAGSALVPATAMLPRLALGESQQDVVAAAQKEGKLVFWGAEEVPKIRRLAQKFAKQYPGIEFEQFRIEPGPAIQRIISEHDAGQSNVDIFDSPVSYLDPILDRDLVARYDWNGVFGVPEDHIYYDGRALACFNLEIPICYNTNKVKPGDVKSWEDLLDPKWKGQVLLEARGAALAVLATKWGVDKTVDYIKKLKANDPVIMIGGSPTAEALASGRVALAIGTYVGKIDLMKRDGAPVDWLLVGPVTAMVYMMLVAKEAKHPNAARLFTAWLTTAEGQAALYEELHYGFDVGSNLSPNGIKMRDAHVEVWQETTDPKTDRKLLETVAAAIGALK